MNSLASTIKRLRQVKEARRQFLALWALECMKTKPKAMDLLASDMAGQRDDAALADPQNRNWSLLYRGSILDD